MALCLVYGQTDSDRMWLCVLYTDRRTVVNVILCLPYGQTDSDRMWLCVLDTDSYNCGFTSFILPDGQWQMRIYDMHRNKRTVAYIVMCPTYEQTSSGRCGLVS